MHPATDDDFEIQVKNTSSRLGGYLAHFLAQAWKNQKPLWKNSLYISQKYLEKWNFPAPRLKNSGGKVLSSKKMSFISGNGTF